MRCSTALPQRALAAALAVCVMASCRSWLGGTGRHRVESLPAGVADSISSESLAPGVTLHHLVRTAGPQRAHILELDLRACVSVRAVKGAPIAVGRERTSVLLASQPESDAALAAVNADFFSFTPPGVPVGAMVEAGRVLAGPIDRPVLAVDTLGRPFLGVMEFAGEMRGARETVRIDWWNRPQRGRTGVVDAAWGQPLDSALRHAARALVPLGGGDGMERASGAPRATTGATRYRVAPRAVDADWLARADTLLLTGTEATRFEVGDSVALSMAWSPVTPWHAVGGYPWLVRDSAVSASIDRDGAESFRGPNPRTLVGLSRGGRRLFLMVIDGRRPGYSVGTTTRETADWIRAAGAFDALNLDGGGSTAMAVRDRSTQQVHLVNRPSDAAGERPVANAVLVSTRCNNARP